MSPIESPSEGLNAAVAAELRAERAAQNLTVQQLAELSDVPYASLRRYLAAERYIDVSVLNSLAGALETSPASLVAAAEERLVRMTTADELAERRVIKAGGFMEAIPSDEATTVDLSRASRRRGACGRTSA